MEMVDSSQTVGVGIKAESGKEVTQSNLSAFLLLIGGTLDCSDNICQLDKSTTVGSPVASLFNLPLCLLFSLHLVCFLFLIFSELLQLPLDKIIVNWIGIHGAKACRRVPQMMQ